MNHKATNRQGVILAAPADIGPGSADFTGQREGPHEARRRHRHPAVAVGIQTFAGLQAGADQQTLHVPPSCCLRAC